jgi:peroxiredoxin
MYFARFGTLVFLLTLLSGCGDNLIPSGEDRRPAVEAGTTGPGVGQQAATFAVPEIGGATVTLSSALAARRGIVLYFTMWCPSCDEQTAQLQTMIASSPGVGFYLVDYVSGSIVDAAASAVGNGATDVGFTILADTAHALSNGFQGTMGSTVVIDSAGTIRMNEDFRDGTRLQAVLAALP